MMRKHKFLGGLSLAVLPAFVLLTAQAQDAKAPAPAPAAPAVDEIKMTERVNAATARALEYIASKQRPDGGWANNNAINGFTLLAFMGRGHTPGRGPHKEVLEKGKKYLLSTQAPTGYTSFGAMYEHGMATLAMAEMYGMDPDPELEEKTRKAVDLIVKVQGNLGGWNYSPTPADGDLSVSVMQIVAMRAANNADIPVPEKAIEKAIAYVRHKAGPGGGYGYAGPGAGPQTSAAGVLSMQLLGKYDDPQIAKTMDMLTGYKATWGPQGGPNYFFYYHYYAIQAFYQFGGKHWNNWHPQIRDLLLEKQNADGSWDVPPGTAEVSIDPNKVYSTAIATLVLDIYLHYLPAYQR
jgi:hypothetical protein